MFCLMMELTANESHAHAEMSLVNSMQGECTVKECDKLVES